MKANKTSLFPMLIFTLFLFYSSFATAGPRQDIADWLISAAQRIAPGSQRNLSQLSRVGIPQRTLSRLSSSEIDELFSILNDSDRAMAILFRQPDAANPEEQMVQAARLKAALSGARFVGERGLSDSFFKAILKQVYETAISFRDPDLMSEYFRTTGTERAVQIFGTLFRNMDSTATSVREAGGCGGYGLGLVGSTDSSGRSISVCRYL